MKYLLAVLTCGRPEYLVPTLQAYSDFLNPRPSAMYVWDDGYSTPTDAFSPFGDVPLHLQGQKDKIGRCSGHAKLWEYAAKSEFDWVFTVEDDVVLLRPLRVNHLVDVLERERNLQQLALIRCPWGREVEYGGYVRQFPDRYERVETMIDGGRSAKWIESTVDWTSSPALLSTSLPRNVEWPRGSNCELTLGPRIKEMRPEAVSGYWGWGEPWSAHVGMERVAGAHGY